MTNLIIYTTVVLAALILFSIGVGFVAKTNGDKHYGIYFIPFVSFVYINKHLENGFPVFTINVKHMLKNGIILIVIPVCCLLATIWANGFYTAEHAAEYFEQIMALPIVILSIILWFYFASSFNTLLFKHNLYFKGIGLVCFLIISIPILGFLVKEKEYTDE